MRCQTAGFARSGRKALCIASDTVSGLTQHLTYWLFADGYPFTMARAGQISLGIQLWIRRTASLWQQLRVRQMDLDLTLWVHGSF